MIIVKFASLLKRIGKNISEIARETGLNRNTIMFLAQNKVKGLRFDTLNKLCKTYHLKIEDVIEFLPDQIKPDKSIIKEAYRQEGEGLPFFLWPGMTACGQFDPNFFTQSYSQVDFFFRNDYFWVYFDKNNLHDLAHKIYNDLANNRKADNLYKVFLEKSQKVISYYQNLKLGDITALSDDEFIGLTRDVIKTQADAWTDGIFIDAFDAGFDQEEINKISHLYQFTPQEVNTLITPTELTFNNARKLAILKIALKHSREAVTHIKRRLEKDDAALTAAENFNYYKSSYAKVNDIKRSDIIEEVITYLKDKEQLKKEASKLDTFAQTQKKMINNILKKHRLKNNPLHFFQRLGYWREHRKMITLMCCNILDLILNVAEERTGIAKKYLKMLSGEELNLTFTGMLDQKQLANRRTRGFLISVFPGGYKMFSGQQALSLKEEWEQKLQNNKGAADIIYGQVASQGYASGKAKIILGEKDFAKFQEGDILITGMTRPEFLPLMKKAAAIVTNEGGITCHAAIISRELGKPCIIGTKVATDLIKDGDLVEVRANHGTVRVIKRV